MSPLRTTISARQATMFVVEAVLIFFSLFLATYFRFGGDMAQVMGYGTIPKGLFITFILMVTFYYNGLYDLGILKKDPIESVIRFLRAFGAAAIIVAIIYFFAPTFAIGRGIVLTFLIVQMAAIIIIRVGIFRWFITSPKFANQILIVGTEEVARRIAEEIQEHAERGLHLLGFAVNKPQEVGTRIDGIPVVCAYDQIRTYCGENGVGHIVVALSDQRERLPLWQLLECKMNGIIIEEVTGFYEKLTGRIMVADIKPSSIIFSEGYHVSKLMLIVKRLSDITFSLLGLLLALPILLVTAVAIKLNSPGTIFFRQERIGQHGRPFSLVKFRTMRADAEKETGPVWASQKDPRVDRLGRLLRVSRIDEIPQMWNVLRGDMSFVGPRPERQFFIRQLQEDIPFYIQRLAVKPGITGWAQTRFQYASSREDALIKLQYDLYYIKHLSFVLDVIIILDTIRVVLLGEGQ